MGKPKGENTKKAAGNAKKAAVNEAKVQNVIKNQELCEEQEWVAGTKGSSKKEAAEAKKAEAARKKAERVICYF